MFKTILQFIVDSSEILMPVAIVIAVALLMYWLAQRALSLMLNKGKLATPMMATLQFIMRWIFIVITLLLVLQQLGVLDNVWAALLTVLATIAIGFVAGWSILSNVFATLLVLVYRPFMIGDHIKVPADEIGGEVIDINFMFTSLKSEDGVITQVPNNTFFMKPVQRVPGEKNITLYEQLQSDKPFNA
ncbi:MAG: mechanosensitive ion channel [Deltaproteobacteria bacterium]|nr:mechanosensitive ion channel [Deltaproteobacteria bacterium]